MHHVLAAVTRNLRLFWLYFRYEAMRFAQYPLDAAAVVISRIFVLGFLMLFWSIVARSNPGTVTVRNIVAYFFILNGFSALYSYGAKYASIVNTMVKQGTISQLLIKPGNTITMVYGQARGEGAIFYVTSLVSFIVGIMLTDTHLRLFEAPILLLAVINGFVLNLALNILLGSIALFVDEATGIKNAILHLTILLRGELIPLYLLSSAIFTALLYSPFAGMAYIPVAIIQHRPYTAASVLLSSVWAVLFMWLAVAIWHRGLKQYEAVGI